MLSEIFHSFDNVRFSNSSRTYKNRQCLNRIQIESVDNILRIGHTLSIFDYLGAKSYLVRSSETLVINYTIIFLYIQIVGTIE